MKIYHFTSFDSIIKILESGLLFFGNLEYKNDQTEGIYQREKICKYIRKKYNNYSSTIIPLFNINTPKNEYLKLYSLSFSSKLECVHNWMEYGDRSHGACIEFNYDLLSKILKEETNGLLFLKSVKYKTGDLHKAIDAIIDGNLNNSYSITLLLVRQYPYFKHSSYSIEKEYRIAFTQNE